MESLALVVGIIFLVALTAGPFALGISFIPVGKYFPKLAKRILVSLFSVAASMSGALLIVSKVAMPARILGLVGLSCASLAISRTFRPAKPEETSPSEQ
ncbi:MAG: hypothetical protein WCP64_08005 [Actinomycetes bacterium]|jgi:membrane protein implicated in regulation of membrane protease activity